MQLFVNNSGSIDRTLREFVSSEKKKHTDHETALEANAAASMVPPDIGAVIRANYEQKGKRK